MNSKTKKNAGGEAFYTRSYKDFIKKVVDDYGGIIPEELFDEHIEESYSESWGPTDLDRWGDQKHPKWKQNVASAKSGLDRRGIIVRYDRVEDIPVTQRKPDWKVSERNGRLYRRVTRTYRVRLPERIVCQAYVQWQYRVPQKKKRSYDPLPQPKMINIVPE